MSRVPPVIRAFASRSVTVEPDSFSATARSKPRSLSRRHPLCWRRRPTSFPPIETEHVVLVANASPTDIDGHRHYRPAVVDQIARERFGVAPIWAPDRTAGTRGDRVGGLLVYAKGDWVDVIDVDA